MSGFTFDNTGSQILLNGEVYESPDPKPRVSLFVTQSIPHNVITAHVWTNEEYDTHNLWSSGATITIPSGYEGHYHILATAFCDVGAGTWTHQAFVSYIKINGTNRQNVSDRPGSTSYWSAYQVNQIDYRLNAGDTVGIDVYQGTGSSRNVSSSLTLIRLGGF